MALQDTVAAALHLLEPQLRRQGVTVVRLSIGRLRATMEAIGEFEAACAKLAARRVKR